MMRQHDEEEQEEEDKVIMNDPIDPTLQDPLSKTTHYEMIRHNTIQYNTTMQYDMTLYIPHYTILYYMI